MSTSNTFRSAVFENQFIRFNYAVSETGYKPFVFFTGFGEDPIHYKRFLKHLPSDFFLLVIKCPIDFKHNCYELDMAIVELLKLYKLPPDVCIGGFSFGNWIACPLLFSKKLTIRSCVFISVPSAFNFRLYQTLNQNKSLNLITKRIIESTCLFNFFKRFANLFLTIKTKRNRQYTLFKKLDFKADLKYYLNTPITISSLDTMFKQANKLAIPCLLLKANNDPVTPSNSFYKLAQKHIQQLIVIDVDSKQHSAFIEEFMKEFGSFLAEL